jgi:hypothetical protein
MDSKLAAVNSESTSTDIVASSSPLAKETKSGLVPVDRSSSFVLTHNPIHKHSTKALRRSSSSVAAATAIAANKQVARTPCQFWMAGSCSRGLQCKFAHPDTPPADRVIIHVPILSHNNKRLRNISVDDGDLILPSSSKETKRRIECL